MLGKDAWAYAGEGRKEGGTGWQQHALELYKECKWQEKDGRHRLLLLCGDDPEEPAETTFVEYNWGVESEAEAIEHIEADLRGHFVHADPLGGLLLSEERRETLTVFQRGDNVYNVREAPETCVVQASFVDSCAP